MERTSATGRSRLLLIITVLVVAANLRPALTVVGPLIERVGSDTGMSAAALGILGAVPVFSFAVVSPFVHLMGRRWGLERSIFVALIVLTLGTLLRSAPGVPYSLFAGTVLLSLALGVTNVLVPIVVRRDFPDRVPMMTGVYTACLTALASVASGVAVPLADSVGWQYTLASTAVLALIATGLWSTRLRRSTPRDTGEATLPGTVISPPPRERNVWASPLAWKVTLFFGFQSAIFYFFITWFAAIHTYHGFSERAAGFSMATFQAVGIVATLVLGRLMQRMRDHRMVALGLGAAMGVGIIGMIVAPWLLPLWGIISGLASTSTLLFGLTMISLRSNSAEQATQLSGMAQGIGYLIGGTGPILAGNLFDLTGSWVTPLYATLIVVAIYTTIGYFCGRNVKIEPKGATTTGGEG